MTTYKKKNSLLLNVTPRYFLSIIACCLALSWTANVGAAEFVYISDNLRVGVRPEPVSSVPPISVVFTGMRLKVHDKVEGYVKITTDKGVEGWIKDIYVTKKAPAIIQLNTFRVKYDKLKKELAQANETASVLETANLALTEQVDELKAERRELTKERAALLATQYKKSSWFWIIEIVVLVLLSFTAGIYWYKNHVMKRLGGLRV